jgi:hypothetical protein
LRQGDIDAGASDPQEPLGMRFRLASRLE